MEWEEKVDQHGMTRSRPVQRVEDIVVPGDQPGPLVEETFLFSHGAMDIYPDPFSEDGAPGLRFAPPQR